MKKVIFLLSIMYIEMSCSSSKSTLKTEKIANFDKQATDHILFLDFTVKKSVGLKPEATKLTNSVSGVGLLKDMDAEVRNPYQVKAVQYYNDGQKPKEVIFEHPLYKSVEIFDQDGTISRKPTSLNEGTLSMRIQHGSSLEKIELYSTTPDKGTVLIYTLTLKK